MKADEFRNSAIALLRSAVGWEAAIARRLRVQPRTVRRWQAAGFIPDWVETKLADLIGKTDPDAVPRDEWIVGDAPSGREYVYHARPPRFLARIVMVDDNGLPIASEEPADVVSGVVYANDDYVLAEAVWIDEVEPGEVVKWLEAAADAIDEMSD